MLTNENELKGGEAKQKPACGRNLLPELTEPRTRWSQVVRPIADSLEISAGQSKRGAHSARVSPVQDDGSSQGLVAPRIPRYLKYLPKSKSGTRRG